MENFACGVIRSFNSFLVFVLAHSACGFLVPFSCCYLACLTSLVNSLCFTLLCRSAPAVRFRTFWILRVHPLRGSCVSERSRCAPSAGIVRVGALPLCVLAHSGSYACTLCGDRACRSAPAVRFCVFLSGLSHPLRGSCVSERSRCAFSRILDLTRALSAGIVRVGALPLCLECRLL